VRHALRLETGMFIQSARRSGPIFALRRSEPIAIPDSSIRTIGAMLTSAEVEKLLTGPLGFTDASNVEPIGSGAWSDAFGFSDGGTELVIRIGEHSSDFRRDEEMSKFTSLSLPIPDVVGIGRLPGAEFDNLHYCISSRAFGTPLEECSSEQWPQLVEQVADALEAMRSCIPSSMTRPDDSARAASWREQLSQY